MPEASKSRSRKTDGTTYSQKQYPPVLERMAALECPEKAPEKSTEPKICSVRCKEASIETCKSARTENTARDSPSDINVATAKPSNPCNDGRAARKTQEAADHPKTALPDYQNTVTSIAIDPRLFSTAQQVQV
ncbi:hypothetical protein ANCCAN_05445 [Ancylostoma caninum]|uniref:Uncharacterized protein n=1 Tax=Ancylostoma caninum TaxID=29170 RepID=A0A368GZM2_ANCCA|nr:hypothetical protein ANCCAN_05445 [Ancylostoma caninum]